MSVLNTWVKLALLIVVAPFLLAGCGTEGTGDKGYIDGKGVITQLPASERKQVGTIKGETLDGKQLNVDSFRGKVVVINVWAQWCAPCRAEVPVLKKAAEEVKSQGVEFLGINTRNSRTAGQAFVRAQGVTYPSIFDPNGQTLLAFNGAVVPSAIPSTVILDKKGRAAALILGEITSVQTLVDLINDAGKDG